MSEEKPVTKAEEKPVTKAKSKPSPQVWKYYKVEGEKAVLLKKFRDVWSPKWALAYVWALPSKRLGMAPLERLAREYSGLVESAGLHSSIAATSNSSLPAGL